MKLVIHPPVDDVRLERIREAAGEMEVVNAADSDIAAGEIIDATAFFEAAKPMICFNADFCIVEVNPDLLSMAV